MVTVHIGQIYFMDHCPYQYPIFMFIIWLYGTLFLILFMHFWYHAYTRGKRPPKTLQNGITRNKTEWKILPQNMIECFDLTIKMHRCTAHTCFICGFPKQNKKPCIFTINYLGYNLYVGGRVNLMIKKRHWPEIFSTNVHIFKKCMK